MGFSKAWENKKGKKISEIGKMEKPKEEKKETKTKAFDFKEVTKYES